MLTRLKVSGFKNLVDVEVRFGPFTCIAGPNGVGKSNLFDAILFLSSLAEKPLLDATRSVRDGGSRAGDLRTIFHHVADEFDETMSFEADMIIPHTGEDESGQKAKAAITFLTYSLELRRQRSTGNGFGEGLELVKEELTPIRLTDANERLMFKSSVGWRRSAIKGERRGGPFISTKGEGQNRVIRLHQDGAGGRPLNIPAHNLRRTILSTVNAAERPTAALAKAEMLAWRLLQLEPSALRTPSQFTDPPRLTSQGGNLAAALYNMARNGHAGTTHGETTAVYARVANRLARLVGDVRSILVDRDEKRELLTVTAWDRHGTAHPAAALSDGTLRFLALAVIEQDPEFRGLICLEEPENGIHPERVAAMLQLLQDITTDPRNRVDDTNPLRQVIVNTHSPGVVQQVLDGSLLIAETREVAGKRRYPAVSFSCLPGTWRCKDPSTTQAPMGKLLGYLEPSTPVERGPEARSLHDRPRRERKVIDRPDIQRHFPFVA